MKLISALTISILITSNCFAMRPTATAMGSIQSLADGAVVRSEIRSNVLSIININFADSSKIDRVAEYFRGMGYQISRIQAGVSRVSRTDRFDVAFMDGTRLTDLQTEIRNVFRFMRADGVLFVKVRPEEDLTLVIDDLILKVEREGDLVVLKRRFENWEQFRQIMDDMSAMLSSTRSA